jgi:antitoxin HicB
LKPQERGGFCVLVPALPEVITEGDIEQEALANAQGTIRAIVVYRRENSIAVVGCVVGRPGGRAA